jgi:RNA polymerase sigma-70 factor, ECF subfamily
VQAAVSPRLALNRSPRPWFGARSEREEAALIRRAGRGSEEAVEALVRRHWDVAHRTAYLIVHDAAAAEDIAQEAMLAALGALDRFDRGRPFGPWLHRIVVNRSRDWLRTRRSRPETSTGEPLAQAVTRVDGLSAELMEALAELDPDDRSLIVLRHVLDYRSSELAAMLDMPAATVRTRLARALERLRARLGAWEEST